WSRLLARNPSVSPEFSITEESLFSISIYATTPICDQNTLNISKIALKILNFSEFSQGCRAALERLTNHAWSYGRRALPCIMARQIQPQGANTTSDVLYLTGEWRPSTGRVK
uniref:hypothetical protein n=1 Tax=Cupriavidus sp. amp6 TaxID=388051 RepID=UPI001E63A51E